MQEYRNVEKDGMKSVSDRTFGLVFGIFFLVLAFLPAVRGEAVRIWPMPLSALLLLLALLYPAALALPNRAWGKFGMLVNAILTPLVMGLVFFGVIMPMGLGMRLLGKRTLAFSRDNQKSYWIARKPCPDESFRHQF